MDFALLQRLQAARPRILVVGDVMLDRYTWGTAERVSPEAPVLILRADSEEVRLGGAASVAALLRGLLATVSIAGVVGADGGAAVVRRLLREAKIDTSLMFEDLSRPTTVKERILGRPEHRVSGQLLRVDHESRAPLDERTESQVLNAALSQLSQFQALLISDYGKGVCTPYLLQSLIREAHTLGIPVLIDPERRDDFAKYWGATLLKPNRAAAALASKIAVTTVTEALAAADFLHSSLEVSSVVITLDRDGMVWQNAESDQGHVSPSASHLRDITGAGDMAHAMLGVCLATHVPINQAVELANLAAGLEVERDGVAPIGWEEINAAAISSHDSGQKVVTVAQTDRLASKYRAERKRIVFTNGCFDLLHVGHVTYLQEAALLGDVLIVAVNSDASVKRLKGKDRPVISEIDRAEMLAALSCVNHVLVFDDDTPHALLRRLRPDVLVKGGTYTEQDVVGREIVNAYGGQVSVVGRVDGVSTTRLLDQITAKSEAAGSSKESADA